MEVEALIVFPDMKSGALSQLTFSVATLIETVTVLPLVEVTIELGLMVIVASLIFESASIFETCAWTFALVALGRVAILAPSRETLVNICLTIVIRPISMMPRVNKIMSGATKANSTNAAPFRGECDRLRTPPDAQRGI